MAVDVAAAEMADRGVAPGVAEGDVDDRAAIEEIVERRTPQIRGGNGRPAQIVAAIRPGDPGRAPDITRHPVPADATVVVPRAVVIGRPAEGLVADPHPAVVAGHGPAAASVGPPVLLVARHEDLAVTGMAHPAAMRAQLVVEEAEAHRDAGARLGGGDEAEAQRALARGVDAEQREAGERGGGEARDGLHRERSSVRAGVRGRPPGFWRDLGGGKLYGG